MMAEIELKKPTLPGPWTWIGVCRSLVPLVKGWFGSKVETVPSPSRPSQLIPQVQTVPSAFRTMQWRAPPQMEITLVDAADAADAADMADADCRRGSASSAP